jgi:cellobiose phosphorylase
LLGLRLEVDKLFMRPLLPDAWDGFKLRYRYHQTVYAITVRKVGRGARSEIRMACDGVAQAEPVIRLQNDGKEHAVEVEMIVADLKM